MTRDNDLRVRIGRIRSRGDLRERRFITVACVGIDDSPLPIISHVGSALQSGDITLDEMRELVLHFSAYYGFAKAEHLDRTATEAWARITSAR